MQMLGGSRLRHEEIYARGYRTMAHVIAHLTHFLETTSNNHRQYPAMHYRSPNAFEAKHILSLLSGQISAP